MGTEKRDRQKANKAAKQEAERAAEAAQRRKQTIRNLTILAVVVVAVIAFTRLTGCSSSASDGQAVKAGSGAKATTTTVASTSSKGEAKATYGTGACAPEAGTAKPVIDFDAAPKQCIDPAKTYTATIKTSEGTVVMKLDTTRTPVTTNNFVNLARSGYFDDTKLFRTEAGTGIIQGGSPHTQDNSDPGPGYTIPDEGLPFTSADYAPGTIAMANTGTPDSASAQFFFLANEGGAYLGDKAQIGDSAGSYAVFGQTTEGLDVLKKIAALDTGAGTPSKPVTIESVTITER